MTKQKSLHVAISTDDNYMPHAAALCHSIAVNNAADFGEIHIHLMHSRLGNGGDKIETLCRENGLILHKYDFADIRERLGVDIPPTIALSSYNRLFLSGTLDSSIDRVVYADVDAVCNGSLKGLWNIDMEGYSVAGVLDTVSSVAKQKVGLQSDSPYVNAGFLLINIDHWRRYGFEKQFLEMLKTYGGNVFHHDQGIINAVCNKTLRILPPQYNVLSNFFMPYKEIATSTPFYTRCEIEKAIASPVFIHFTPGIVNRPWFANCRHPYRGLYLQHRNATPYSLEALPFDNRPAKLRLLSWLYWHARPLYRLTLALRSRVSSKI